MKKRMNMLARAAKRTGSQFRNCEDGNQTINFVFLFPAIMLIFLNTIEVGIYSIRHVVLERGLDVTVRNIRLNTSTPVSANDVRRMICQNSLLIPDCDNSVKVEMRPVDPRNVSGTIVPREVSCVDRSKEAKPAGDVATGIENDLMILRVCALFDPFFPTTGLGRSMPKVSEGAYALVSTAAFAMEPI
ncbi:TadE/TadG family type IV pilus assembly protein [Aestuariibius insulae]|uniref:TadE/TadG family type IV pilus assembly protein n=1 Tax=Aestuariibius insulae TaxID=2058287 RepID=UPI00345F0F2A